MFRDQKTYLLCCYVLPFRPVDIGKTWIILQRAVLDEPTFIRQFVFLAEIFDQQLLFIGHLVLNLGNGTILIAVLVGYIGDCRAIGLVKKNFLNFCSSWRCETVACRQMLVYLLAVEACKVIGLTFGVELLGQRNDNLLSDAAVIF